MRKFLFSLWLACIALVVHLSLKPSLNLPGNFWGADKVFHTCAYTALMLLPALLFKTRRRIWIAVSVIALGIVIEYVQPSFGRTFEYGDMAADAIGVALGLWLGLKMRPRLTAIL